jgi:hypothetical protein
MRPAARSRYLRELRARKAREGTCRDCTEPALQNHVFCPKHASQRGRYQTRYKLEPKMTTERTK